VRSVIEVQLDPQMSPRERTRRLEKALAEIEYWHQSNPRAARCHRKRRRRELRRLGIRLSQLRKCFNVF
jgi:hypothetical protein